MKLTTVLLLNLLTIQPSAAVDYRWTKGFGQETFEAIIDNASGASLNIYCRSGQEYTTLRHDSAV